MSTSNDRTGTGVGAPAGDEPVADALELPCSDGSRARGDQMVGTAPPARRWFLVEQDGAWGRTAWDGLDCYDQAKEALRAELEGVGARLQLIRRHGARPRPGRPPRRWCAVDVATGSVRWGTARCDGDLVRAASAFSELTAEPGQPQPGKAEPGDRSTPADAGTEDSAAPIILVCTHGLKDVCCAVRGRPVAAALAERWPETVWESTHTGGDRFAANVVLLPDGAVYGGTDPDTAAADVTTHLEGQVDPTRLRGRAGLSSQAQAAHAAALDHAGPMGWHDAVVREQTGDAEAWQVQVDTPTGTLRIHGTTHRTEPHRLTCRAAGPAPMTLSVVTSVEPA
ncbi:sucrase ferredoxin [Kytococcus sp. Marseille-QA3725]